MDFKCLGRLEARVDGIPVDLGEPQQRLVLALLLANADSVVSTDRLADGIWGDEPPESGRKIIQGYVSGLRKALGDSDIIESRRPGYRLNVKPDQVDALIFEERAAEGASEVTTDPQHARQVLMEALSLWRGVPYEDLADSDALRPEIARLEQLHAAAIEVRIEADIFIGQESAVVAELADLTRRFPLRERLWSLRMLALYRSGRQAGALRVYDEARGVLAVEVGLKPSTELQLLRDRMLRQDPILETSAALDIAAANRPTVERNPYKGLRPFDEDDAQDFFGRDDLVRRLRGALKRRNVPRLVVLTGSSGSGKSSVVRAGLLPRLRREGWHIASMYPGTAPVEEFRTAVTDVEGAKPAVIVIDQLEEAFTLVSDTALSAEFLDTVVAAVDTSTEGPWVVATVRADFLEFPMGYRAFAELLDEALMIVTPLADHEVRDVITEPASRVGVSVEPDLVAAMVQEVGDQPTALPLLQFALTDLFDRAAEGQLTLDAYHAAGGIAGALIERAEAAYAEFDGTRRETTKQLMLRLVAVREDTEPVRRRVPVASLAGLSGLERVLDTFGEHRLITFDRHTEGEPTVEVAHEALLREWPRLRSWIDEATVALRRHTQVAEAAEEWATAGRSDVYLLTGARLARLADWEDTGIVLTDTEVEFLEASIDHEEELRARRRRRRRWVLAAFGTAALLSAVLAGLAFQSSRVADQQAREARAAALAGSVRVVLDEDPELSVLLGIEALELAPDSDAALAALTVALQAHRTVFAVDRSGTPPTVGSISPDGELLAIVVGFGATIEVFDVDDASRPLWAIEAPLGGALDLGGFTTEGSQILVLTLSPDPDTDSQKVMWTLRDARSGRVDHAADVEDVCLFPYLWGAHPSRGFVDLDQPIWMVRNTACVWPLGSSASLVAFDVWTGSAEEVTQFEYDLVGGPTLSADGSRFAYASGGPGGVFDANSEEPLLELPPGVSTLSADGSLVIAGNDPMLLLDIASGGTESEFQGNYSRAHFSSTGRYVIAASFDGATRVFDTFGGQELFELRGSGSRDLRLQMTTDERRLATFSPDGARVWDVESQLFGTASRAVYQPIGGGFLIAAGVISTTEHLVAPISMDGSRTTAIYELATGAQVGTLPGRAVAVSPDASTLVMQSWPGTTEITGHAESFHQVGGFVLVDVASGDVLGELRNGPCVWYNRIDAELAGPDCGDYPAPWAEWARSGSFSPDGSLLAIGGYSGYVVVWDLSSGEVVHFVDSVAGGSQTQSGSGGWSLVQFTPSGDQLAVHQFEESQSAYVLTRWNTATWQPEAEINLEQPLTEMEYTPDGSLLLGGGSSADITVVDAERWEVIALLEGQQGGRLEDVDVSPDGRLAVAAAQNGVAWVWDLEIEGVVHRMDFPATGSTGGVVNVEFVDDQTILVSGESSAVLMTLDPRILLELAKTRVTRGFTEQECATYEIEPCGADPYP